MPEEIGWASITLRLLMSILLGGCIGLEREIHGKSAGLRTHTLVALGSGLFTILSYALPKLAGFEGATDPTRIAAQIITGVGFLGAGTIMQARGGVHGLTTAASIWLVAAIGMAAGGGFFPGALIATVMGVLVLVALSQFEQAMIRRGGWRYVITVKVTGQGDVAAATDILQGIGVAPSRWQYERQKECTSIRIEGRFTRQGLDGLLADLEAKCQVADMRVDR
jgi:putative Mg2+ transporter-C (MgtC) family protein